MKLFSPLMLALALAATSTLTWAEAPASTLPAPAAASAWEVKMASEPNSRGVRGVLLRAAHRLCFGLQQADGSVLPARGAMDGTVWLDFIPTQLCWVTDTCLLAFAPCEGDMQPHVLRWVGDPEGNATLMPNRRSRVALIELPGTLKGPTAKSRNLPGYNYRWRLRLELRPSLQAAVSEGVLRLQDAEGNTAFSLDCKKKPAEAASPRGPRPDYESGIPMATKARQQAGFGDNLEVARVFPANGKGERVVALIPREVSERRDSFFVYALLTPERTLLPLGTPDMSGWAKGFDWFSPGTFRWLDDDTFCLHLDGRIEVWRLSTPRQALSGPNNNQPSAGVECLLRGHLDPNLNLHLEPGALRFFAGETPDAAVQVGEVRW